MIPQLVAHTLPTRLGMPDRPCHSCRRRRVKCDRAVPQCQKCLTTGTECLGYGKLILWNQGVASRGKMMGKTFPTVRNQADGSSSVTGQGSGAILSTSNRFPHDDFYQQRLAFPLIDPLFQDLSPSTRRYLSHFGSNFVKELVIYDVPDQNPVRQLLRYSREYPVLLQVIVATSAHHLYNISPSQTFVLRDALSSKGRALELLKDALSNIGLFDVNIMLAVVMLLIYFEWIQSGKNTWRIHLEGAKSLIRYIKCHAGKESTDSFAGLFVRRWLISEFLM